MGTFSSANDLLRQKNTLRKSDRTVSKSEIVSKEVIGNIGEKLKCYLAHSSIFFNIQKNVDSSFLCLQILISTFVFKLVKSVFRGPIFQGTIFRFPLNFALKMSFWYFQPETWNKLLSY